MVRRLAIFTRTMDKLNPGSKGWIKKYFTILNDYSETLNRYPRAMMTPEELIYGYLQPTGIMYGFPTSLLFLDSSYMDTWNNEESFKVLLLEGLILVDHIQEGEFDMSSLEGSLARFVEFYEATEIERAKKSWLDFKGLDTYEKLESIIAKRVDIKTSFSHKLWTSYLNNSLIFQDLLLYHEFHCGASIMLLSAKRADFMLDMVKVVACAAHADGEVKEEEQAIFDVFMASARLEGQRRDIAKTFWEEGGTINEIEFKYNTSWLLNRYILEIAILTVWSDRVVVESEHQFLNELIKKLDIPVEEKDKSFIAIETFVMNNYDQVPFLKGKNDTELLVGAATERWKIILGRNKDKLAAELNESKELVRLIAKSTSEDLSKEEKERAKNQFKDLARTIPSLTLFMLPGGSLLLPIVLKAIPDLIPTAFRNNQIDEDDQHLFEEEE
ncbi:MAG: LETM1-related biofilm-associated protein [Flavobacteriales bacterium]|nr:LETM1-related biofilm-associated protein [Flavobacteriales bacterium]